MDLRKPLKALVKHSMFFCVLFTLLFANVELIAAQQGPLLEGFQAIEGKIPLPKITNATDLSATGKITYFIRMQVIPIAKYIFISVSIFFIAYYGISLVVSTSEDETSAQKDNLLWAAVGFAMLGISSHIVDALNPAGTPAQEVAQLEGGRVAINRIILYIELFIGSIATFFITIAAVRTITAQGAEEEITKQKTNFTWGAIGLMVVMLAEVTVRTVYRVDQSGTASAGDATTGIEEIAGIISFVLQFLGAGAVLSLVIGGVYYITSFGNEEQTGKAKNMVFASILAIVIIVISYAFVATLLR